MALIKMEDNPMKYYVGLDISNIDTSICIVDQEGNIVKEAKVLSDPASIDAYLQKTGMQFEAIGLEAGALSHWLVNGLREKKWNVICIDSRFMAAILTTNINKTDRNDARAIANAIRCKNYREVHIKSIESVKTNCLLTARKILVRQKQQLKGTIRGLLKTFGIKLGKGSECIRSDIQGVLLLEESTPNEYTLSAHVDWSVFESLIVCVEKLGEQLKVLDHKLDALARSDKVVQRFLTHPGVGVVTAFSFKAEIDDPTRFKKSRSVGAYLGMSPRQFSSGETIKQGRVSKHGSSEVRALLHEAGVVLITRTKAKSKLKKWGLKKKQKMKTQKTGMAVGRRIAINLHQMWIKDRDFDPQMDVGELDCGESVQRKPKEKKTKQRNVDECCHKMKSKKREAEKKEKKGNKVA
jgi:transposase